ncbi:MAG: RNA-binding S4 domain-containing protein [Fimbriimonadaceae bacterium]|nr:RNA-binding S4 domain-containing protein [Fimbriimonadaceae bacterium]
MPHRETFAIRDEYIELQQLLKAADVVQSGGDAKYLIQEDLIEVNGEVENRRAKKLRVGDVILIEGELEITIVSR